MKKGVNWIENWYKNGKNWCKILCTHLMVWSQLYTPQYTIRHVGTSDHETMVTVPTLPKLWEPRKQTKVYSSHVRKCQVAEALQEVSWQGMYRLPSCQLQFELFQWIISDTVNTLVPIREKRVLSNLNLNDKARIMPANQVNGDAKSLPSNFFMKSVNGITVPNTMNCWKAVKIIFGQQWTGLH